MLVQIWQEHQSLKGLDMDTDNAIIRECVLASIGQQLKALHPYAEFEYDRENKCWIFDVTILHTAMSIRTRMPIFLHGSLRDMLKVPDEFCIRSELSPYDRLCRVTITPRY